MTETGDGVEEGLTTTATVALTAAARAGEHLARMREQSHRAAQIRAQESGQQLAQRLAAEQQAAAAYFAAVSRPEYLDHASEQDLARAYREAVVWRSTDPGAAQAEQVLAERYRQRFGTGHTPAADGERATTVALVAGADAADAAVRRDPAAQQPDSPEWDSRERREQLAANLHQTVNNPAAVQARLTADTANGLPPQDAVRPSAGRPLSPSRTPAPGRVRSLGLER